MKKPGRRSTHVRAVISPRMNADMPSWMRLTLDYPKVRAAMLAENAGDLTKSNVVSRLAEQLARGLFDSGYAQAVDSPDALRDAVNKFRYRSPDTLPGRAPASRLSSESHSFSRVFTGA